MSRCFVFAGPTLYGAEAAAAMPTHGVQLLPPVKRGDINELVSGNHPGVVAIVDGLFHQFLAVGHAEIRDALRRGWKVWGLSSMGAIRAYEMRHLGVRGYGRVYHCFFEHEDFRDDEVALVHEPTPPYRALSEPLIHVRFWLAELLVRSIIDGQQQRRILDDLMSVWFGDRTLPRIRSTVLEVIPRHERLIDDTLADFDRFRVKCHDLSNFLKVQAWIDVRAEKAIAKSAIAKGHAGTLRS